MITKLLLRHLMVKFNYKAFITLLILNKFVDQLHELEILVRLEEIISLDFVFVWLLYKLLELRFLALFRLI